MEAQTFSTHLRIFFNTFYWLCYYSCPISPHLFPTSIPPFSSCPLIVHISSLVSPFPILFLTSPCLFCAYQLCFLFPMPFSPILPLHLPTDNPSCDLHFCDSVPVLIVCLVFCFLVFRFCCWYLWVCCHFTVHIIIFFFLDKSLFSYNKGLRIFIKERRKLSGAT